MIKKISQHKILITATLIFLGLLYLHCYYRKFHVVIWYYLEPDEIILSFLPIIFNILIFIFTVVLFQMYFQVNLKKHRSIFFYLKHLKNPRISRKIKLKLVWVILRHYQFLAFIISTFSVIALLFHWPPMQLYYFLFLPSFFTLTYKFIAEKYQSIFKKAELSKNALYLTIFIFYLIAYIAVSRSDEAISLRDESNSERMKFSFKLKDQNQVIKSDSNFYFVGMTRNFIFMHHPHGNTVVFDRSNIDSLSFN